MREWIDLFEAVNENESGLLYHGTSLSHALDIIHQGVFHKDSSLSHSWKIAHGFTELQWERLADRGEYHRDVLNCAQIAEWDADHFGGGCVLVFDEAKLRRDIGLQSFVFEPEANHPVSEEEEIVLKDVTPVTNYLVAIDGISEWADFDEWAEFVSGNCPHYKPSIQTMRKLIR